MGCCSAGTFPIPRPRQALSPQGQPQGQPQAPLSPGGERTVPRLSGKWLLPFSKREIFRTEGPPPVWALPALNMSGGAEFLGLWGPLQQAGDSPGRKTHSEEDGRMERYSLLTSVGPVLRPGIVKLQTSYGHDDSNYPGDRSLLLLILGLKRNPLT